MILKRAEPIYRQIALHFEKEIFEGRLKTGDKLPSTKELVLKFGVNHESIQNGLKILADRGLIERRRKCGSFVKALAATKTIGLVFGRENCGNPDMAFFNILLDKVAELFLRNGSKVRYYASSLSGQFDHSLYEMESDASSGALSALLNISASGEAGAWMRKSCLIPNFICPISFDLQDFIEQGLGHLAANGRRRPALIFDEEHLFSRKEVEGHLAKASSRYGMNPIGAFHAKPSQRGGYAAARQIMDTGNAPDSFLVLYDNSFRGVLYHLMERGVNIPSEAALISHSNKGVDIMCHMPLTRLEYDPEDFARQVMEQVDAKLEGRTCRVVPLKARLIAGKTCGES